MKEIFDIIKKGYNPIEVDRYIDELEAVIKSYKEKDAAIKNAIINAQMAAESIIGSAEAQAGIIIKNAENEASEIKAETVRFLDKALEATVANKHHINSFRQEYHEMIQKYISPLDEDETARLIFEAEEAESYITRVKASIIDQD